MSGERFGRRDCDDPKDVIDAYMTTTYVSSTSYVQRADADDGDHTQNGDTLYFCCTAAM